MASVTLLSADNDNCYFLPSTPEIKAKSALHNHNLNQSKSYPVDFVDLREATTYSQSPPLDDRHFATVINLQHHKCQRKYCPAEPRYCLLLAVLLVLVMSALILAVIVRITVPLPSCTSPSCIHLASRILSRMNTSISPCDNFYDYACGRWISETEVPDSFYNWHDVYRLGVDAWTDLEKHLADLRTSSSGRDPLSRLYESCLDEPRLEQIGFAPLKHYVQQTLGGWPRSLEHFDVQYARQFTEHIAHLHNSGLFPLFWTGVVVDDFNTSRHILLMDQPSVSLSFDRTQLSNGTHINHITSTSRYLIQLERLMSYLSVVLGHVKPEEAAYLAREMLMFEIELIKVDLHRLFELSVNRKLSPDQPIIVNDLSWLAQLNDLVIKKLADAKNMRTLDNYLKWRVILPTLSFISPTAFPKDIQATLPSLIGATGFSRRSMFCITSIFPVAAVSMASMYVVNRPQIDQIRHQARQLAFAIQHEALAQIEHLGWIDRSTKVAARRKIEQLAILVGYSDTLLNRTHVDAEIDQLSVSTDDFFGNMMRGIAYRHRWECSRLGTKPDRYSWSVDGHPLKPNAYYTFKLNRIVVPVAILQQPVFTPGTPAAANFGALGFFIAHELMHAFDAKGKDYDATGNIGSWWSLNAYRTYADMARCLANQYSHYRMDGVHLMSTRSNNEDLADNGALALAYKAFKRSQSHITMPQTLPGANLTSSQLFFVSFAQSWCAKSSVHYRTRLRHGDVHSPERYRVIGSLHNFAPFSQAFNCPAGSAMNPGQKCSMFW